jgi:hypothetical protein
MSHTYYLVAGILDQQFVLCSARLNELDLQTLLFEVGAYNVHIKNLNAGMAPPSSYVDSDVQIARFMAQNSRVYQHFKLPMNMSRDNYEKIEDHLYVVRDDGIEYIYDTEDEIDEGTLQIIQSQKINTRETVEYITRPFDPYNSSSIGFWILPLTKKMLDH